MADRIDIPSFQIAASKMRADGSAYFRLFEKHVPRNLSLDSVVLLYKLDNLSCIYKIINMNSKAHYVVVSNDAVNTALRAVLDKSIDVKYIEEFDFEETDMKFDAIVMNPPYSRNLHLKILAEAIKHLKDEKSVCVNLSPVRWLQDPLAKYKKNCDLKRFEESVAKHIESLDILTSNMAQELFKIGMQTDIGIYKCRKSASYIAPNLIDKIVAKAAEYYSAHVPVFDMAKYDGWRVRIPTIIGGKSSDGHGRIKGSTVTKISIGNLYCFFDGKKNGKFWYDWYNRNQYTKTTQEITCSISFSSEVEAENFIKQFSTNFIGFVSQSIWSDVHIAPDKVFWMGDAINPRTGLKGYQSEWTDADLYQFFSITPEEQKVIEDTMKKYETA